MELTLNQIPMEGYIRTLDTVVYQEETQESIVPDACPDIGRVLATEAQASLTRKEWNQGKAEMEGSVRVTVVYWPEGDEGARRLEVCIPYRATAAGGDGEGEHALVGTVRVLRAETRVLNPRKVLCRVELAVGMRLWQRNQNVLCAPCEGCEVELQQRVEETESYLVTAVGEKAFAYTDQINLSGGHSAARELLGHRLELRSTEAKTIGNKLVFKGEVGLSVRYRTEEDTLAVGRWELPFSQIMELETEEEEGSCVLELVERESQVELLSEGEGRTLSVHLELLAQAEIRQNRPLTLFADAYSTSVPVMARMGEYTLTQRWEESALTQMGRMILETEQPARGVEDCFITLSQPSLRRETGELSARGWVTVLYLDEEGTLQSQSGEMTVTTQVALPDGGEVLARCQTAGEPQAAATAAGIEVRCDVRFSYLITCPRQVEAVVGLEAEEEPEEQSRRPSVVLRMAQSGETLWHIAKAYSTTEADILSVNDISDPQRPEGQLLLIPRCR